MVDCLTPLLGSLLHKTMVTSYRRSFLIILVLWNVLNITSANPCTNGELLENAAIKCSAKHLLKLLGPTPVTEKCGIVLDGIRPCVMEAIARDHNRTCTARERHELIHKFRESIATHLKFDVIQCIPVMNCTDFESIMYYLDIHCDSQFQIFVDYSNCQNMCNLGTCFADEFNRLNISCTIIEFQNTILSNIPAWESETGTREADICCDSNKTPISRVTLGLLFVALTLLIVL